MKHVTHKWSFDTKEEKGSDQIKEQKHRKKEKKKEKTSTSDKNHRASRKRKHKKLDTEPSHSREPDRERSRKYSRLEKVDQPTVQTEIMSESSVSSPTRKRKLPFDYKYVLAPMVGASELAFRLLCRKYGAQLAYTPMMSSTKFATDAQYRATEFQTIPQDRPLVCHFAANNPRDFAAAAKLCEDQCDAIDLNLGCPQRTAYVGHFGSYLLEKRDRELVLDIIRAGAAAVKIPIFCKIRLLNTLEETVSLCKQLADAGASLIAIHARYRASFERKGPGARDGPALLDQVLKIKKALPEVMILANGNVDNYDDVVQNLEYTQADGIMSAEGILDNPGLFLPRLGTRQDKKNILVTEIPERNAHNASVPENQEKRKKKERKLLKKIREIEEIQEQIKRGGEDIISADQREKLAAKRKVQKRLEKLKKVKPNGKQPQDHVPAQLAEATTRTASLAELYESADDPLRLATEYLSLVRRYPIKIRSVIFHTRRMLKNLLNQYQLMEECVACQSVEDVEAVLSKCSKYRADPDAFIFDTAKAAREKEALENKRREEGKRKAYEARMIRKAKREKRTDLEYYLRMGAEVPTVETIQSLQALPREQQLERWKKSHSQHCMSHHLDAEGCTRDRACAFLHVDAKGKTTFVESEEVAG